MKQNTKWYLLFIDFYEIQYYIQDSGKEKNP